MKVKTLIKQLQKLNQDATVFIASDAEGNAFSAIDDVNDEGGDLAFNGERSAGYVEFGVLKENSSQDPVYKKPAVILYPV